MAPMRAIACACALLALAACDREPPKPKTGPGAGVAVRVNGAGVPERPTAYALERAIDQEVVVQRAMADEEAAPLIRQFLAKQRRGQLAQAEVQKLRSAARIEYLNPPAVAGLF